MVCAQRGDGLCSKRRRVSCGQGLHAHTGQREADKKREHHERFSSPCPLRRLVIVNSREREKHVQRSGGLQREQRALGWKLKGSGEFNQMPVPSLCWKSSGNCAPACYFRWFLQDYTVLIPPHAAGPEPCCMARGDEPLQHVAVYELPLGSSC